MKRSHAQTFTVIAVETARYVTFFFFFFSDKKMPTYDLVLLLKKMDRPVLIESLKRNADYIFKEGGIIRKMDNLGFRPTPYRMINHGVSHKEAHYFIFNFDLPSRNFKNLKDALERDTDVVRRTLYLMQETPGGSPVEKPKKECTLYKDLLPPPYREKVQEMIEISKQRGRKKKHEFHLNTGLDYHPFQFK